MNESHVVLKLDEYKNLVSKYNNVMDECIQHRRVSDETFGVKYSEFSGIPTFYTKKELSTEILSMFDTLQANIKELQEEVLRFKNMGFVERFYRWTVKGTFMDLK